MYVLLSYAHTQDRLGHAGELASGLDPGSSKSLDLRFISEMIHGFLSCLKSHCKPVCVELITKCILDHFTPGYQPHA